MSGLGKLYLSISKEKLLGFQRIPSQTTVKVLYTFLLIYFLRLSFFSDYSLGYEFPFRLKAVNKDGTQCAWCPWYRFCRGCEIQCCDSEFAFSSSCIAIDWDPTALHLRYQTSQESVSPSSSYNASLVSSYSHYEKKYPVYQFFFQLEIKNLSLKQSGALVQSSNHYFTASQTRLYSFHQPE